MGDKDFFLSPDDAQTMGDINYMRTPKRTRRTFPKTLKNKDGFAIEKEVSSSENISGAFKEEDTTNGVSFSSFQSVSTSTPAPKAEESPSELEGAPAPAPAPAPANRRKSDSSMDMFRNMAKNIRR